MNNVTDRYAVIGNPIAHSLSPEIHLLFAEQTNERITYEKLFAPPGDFARITVRFFANEGRGLNVTVPFKREACGFVDQTTQFAENSGAVNTILLQEDGTYLGANTDGIGLLRDLKKSLHLQVQDRSVLILGAGGATRGIVEPLLREQPAELLIANRTPDRAETIAAMFRHVGRVRSCALDEIPVRPYDLILHATSAPLQNSRLTLPGGIVSPNTCCYDLMYGKDVTSFMRWALAQNAGRVVDGFGMLLEQAAESFFLWRGKRPDTDMARKCLRPDPAA